MRILSLAVAAACFVALPACAQNIRTVARDTTSLTDTVSLREYMDAYFAKEMDFLHVPGAVAAIVYKGNIAMLRGYGVGDIDNKTPIDPARTVFRAGSVTKTFTATGIMQLVEQGKVDLSVDVNRYLRDMKVPSAFGAPVTISQLLTHTAGFDTKLAGTAAPTESDVEPLGAYLNKSLPKRVRPPGRTLAYSNFGYALLGHVIEQVSGESYADYMKRHIFDPLDMTSSSMKFTKDVKARAPIGYEPRGLTGHRVAPPLHPNITPAASLNTTAADMAKFMIAQLRPAGGTTRILSDSLLHFMQARQFAAHPKMPGVTYGLYESNWHGRRIVFHSGGIRGFTSAMYLFPDDDIGFFVADNGYRGDLIFVALFHFMERYLPATAPVLKAKRSDAGHLKKYAGFYQDAQHTVSTLEKAGGLRNEALEIRATDSGTITAFGTQFLEVEPGFFRERKGWETLAFIEDASGRVSSVVTTYPFPGTQVWERIPFIRTGVPSQIVMIWTLILSMAMLVRPLHIREDTRWARSISPAPRDMIEWSRRTRWFIRAIAGTQLGFLLLMWLGSRSKGGMLYGVPWQMDAAGILAVLGAFMLLVLVIRQALALRAPHWPWARLLPVMAFSVSSFLFVSVQGYWNLLGIHH